MRRRHLSFCCCKMHLPNYHQSLKIRFVAIQNAMGICRKSFLTYYRHWQKIIRTGRLNNSILIKFLERNLCKTLFSHTGRLLVHEWGHFRWGLFNEYPDEQADQQFYSEFFYSSIREEYQATRYVLHFQIKQKHDLLEANLF